MPSPQKFCNACKGKGSTNQKDAPCIEQRENCIKNILFAVCDKLFSVIGIDEPCTVFVAFIEGELDGTDWRNISKGALINYIKSKIWDYLTSLDIFELVAAIARALSRLDDLLSAIDFLRRTGCCLYNTQRCLRYVDQGGCMTEGNGGGPQTWKDICNPGFVGPVDVR
jgi:hypothetical protein